MLEDGYNKFAPFLMATFGTNFIFVITLLTTATSIVYFVVISYIITQMDKRYFIRKRMSSKTSSDEYAIDKPYPWLRHSCLSYLFEMAKIIVGAFLLVCGLVMLVLPGQGLITILIGLSLIPFPGKDKLEQNLLARKSVRSSLNWIRIKANKDPFIFD